QPLTHPGNNECVSIDSIFTSSANRNDEQTTLASPLGVLSVCVFGRWLNDEPKRGVVSC
ncbi:hypothetical protein CSUI_001727, partial [Cystoisospora suis]